MPNFYATRSTTELILTIVLIVVGIWYISTQAGRLDRLHHRVNTAAAALDTQLARRAGVVAELAHVLEFDPVTSVVLSQSAHEVLAAGNKPWDERADLENQLTEALTAILDEAAELRAEGELTLSPAATAQLTELYEAWQAMQLSRRFYADAVRACLVIRQQKLVRWFRLAGHARLPQTHDFNDEMPSGLTALISALGR